MTEYKSFKNTQYKVLKGKGKWVKVYIPDNTFGDPVWKLDLYLTPESVETFKSLGVKNRINHNDDGDYVHLKRETEKTIKGARVTFPPPVVIDKEGNPFNQHIGDGSDLTVTVEYYGFNPRTGLGGPGKAIRIHTVQVDNLSQTPYVPKENANETNNLTAIP